MNWILALLLFIVTILPPTLSLTTIVDGESSCRCHHGYAPVLHPKDKKFYCHGILHEGKKACVNLERPRCKCNLGQGFVVQDLYGYWCVKVKPGFIEEIRWDCENKRDWDQFFKVFPEEKPVADSEI